MVAKAVTVCMLKGGVHPAYSVIPGDLNMLFILYAFEVVDCIYL
jgi:hypothetical protein